MNFDELSNIYSNNTKSDANYYNLNDNGKKLLSDYHEFIERLSEWVSQDAIINVISVISAEKKGTKKFEDANRLDTLTNGGKTPINTSSMTFNKNDSIIKYLT